ncbi:MAG: hypothetical protein EXS46_01365 [Candidatus Taylorbacteria bacterium]|nr:hypothetical protein [Candidatus Taylorbacteria bacterium]
MERVSKSVPLEVIEKEKLGLESQETAPSKTPTTSRVAVPACFEHCEAARRGNCLLLYRPERKNERETEKAPASKTWISFLGMPGAGKSTQIERLTSVIGAPPAYHMGAFAKKSDKNIEKGGKGSLIQGLDEDFLVTIAKDSSPRVVLDGFPRSLEQLRLLEMEAQKAGADMEFIFLDFVPSVEGEVMIFTSEDERARVSGTDQVRQSYVRQLERDAKSGREPDHEKYVGKIERALAQDMAVVKELRGRDKAPLTIDAQQSPDEIADAIRERLGLGFEQLPWRLDILQELQYAAQETGIEAWATSGSIYRAFWNKKYGPTQESLDIDVTVDTPEQAKKLEVYLEKYFPDRRWSVYSWQEHAGDKYNTEGELSFTDDLKSRVLTFRQGAAKIEKGKLVVKLTPQAESDLRNGIVRMDQVAIDRLSPENREYHLSKTIGTLKKLLDEYPGLTLDPELAVLFKEAYGYTHAPAQIEESWAKVEQKVLKMEKGGKERWNYVDWTPEERRIADGIVNFYVSAERNESAPPVPRKSKLPALVEEVRAGIRKPEQIPDGYENWLHYVSATAPDAEFREWLINQTRSRQPVGGRDPEIESVLTFNKFAEDKRIKNFEAEQKATHAGWPLYMHLKQSMLQLDTDSLLQGIEDVKTKELVRLASRVALLYHDVGKLLNLDTPGAHEGAGAKMFLKYKPAWVPDDVAELAQFLISNHDLFGRLARGITEKATAKLGDPNFDVTAQPAYKGALDPEKVREKVRALKTKTAFDDESALAMVREIWKADVASVASLRWLLPAADKLSALIKAKL